MTKNAEHPLLTTRLSRRRVLQGLAATTSAGLT